MKISVAASIIAFTAGVALAAPVHNGKATYYEQKGNYGSCGKIHADSDFIVAASSQAGTHCWQQVQIENVGGGHNNNGVGNTIIATVVDTCPDNECDGNHLDLSVGAFKALTGGSLDPPGAINIRWS